MKRYKQFFKETVSINGIENVLIDGFDIDKQVAKNEGWEI